MKFSDFDLDQRILDGLEALQYEETTPIQKEGIPIALEGRDLIGLAQTGTGKTGAFVVPILQEVIKKRDTDESSPHALILTPTRELAKQVDEMIFAMGYYTGVSSATVIGGEDFSAQARHIREGVDVLVATPGRLLDILNVLNFELSSIHTLVLDEADRMLDMGFYPDVSKIVGQLPKKRQTMMFSATMSSQIEKLSRQIMNQPKRIEFEVSKPVDTVEQHAYFVENDEKLNLVEQLFEKNEWESAIVFAATKKWTEKLHQKLQKRGIDSVSIHGDRSQEERNESLHKFKSGQNPVIVATDVLSRGIDIDDVSMIINYDLPQNSDDYIHRIGRTGRHKKKGISVTFVTKREKGKYKGIKQEVGLDIKEYPASALMNESGSSDQKKKSRSRSDGKNKSRDASDKQSKRKSSSTSSSKKKKTNAESAGETSDKKSSAKSSSNKSKADTGDDSDKKQKDNKTAEKTEQSKSKAETGPDSGKKDKQKSSNRSVKASSKQSGSRSKKTTSRSQSSRKRNKRTKPNNRREGNRSKKSGSPDKTGRSSNNQPSKKSAEKRSQGRGAEPDSSPSNNGRDQMVVRRIEKAIQRNKNTRKPAKGLWGVIKSLIPRIKRD